MSYAYYHYHQPANREVGRGLFITIEPWSCRWTYKGNTRYLYVPIDTIWDGASIPRAGWSLIGLTPGGEMTGPSLAHDIPYRSKGGRLIDRMQGAKITDEDGNRVYISRKEADWLLQAAMKHEGIRKAKCGIVYSIVRIFGRRHWGGPMPCEAR